MERRHRQVERQRHSSGGAIRAAAPPSGPERDTWKPTLTRRSGRGPMEERRRAEEGRRSGEGAAKGRRGGGAAKGLRQRQRDWRILQDRVYMRGNKTTLFAENRGLASDCGFGICISSCRALPAGGSLRTPARPATTLPRAAQGFHAEHGADKKDPAEAEPFSGDFCVCFSVDSIR